MKKFFLISLTACVVVLLGANTSLVINQPVLGVRSAAVLEKDGLKFKDLNKNNQVDKYEDWRLTSEERSKDLLSQMSLEEKVGFMLISDTRMENQPGFFDRPSPDEKPITSNFNENDVVTNTNMFTRTPLPVPLMSAAGTTKAINQYHLRHFILRTNTTVRIMAEWSNNLQAACEKTKLGIPAIVASNPRNHYAASPAAGTTLGGTSFSRWPGELGLAAMRDFKLTRAFADIARQEWAAVGLRKGYMYMADLSTEPRWQRTDGTFGENAELAASMMTEIVLGFQGDKLSNTSVALTTKHFPGGGATKDGQDPHFDFGKNEVFPGKMLENNLIPFKAAIKAGTSSIMPYYSIPTGTKYQEVAYAYNKQILQDLLRTQLGFKGIINSDTGPIDMMPWGVEDRTVQERYKMSIEAGVNIFSGNADPTQLLAAIRSGMIDMKYIDDSVLRLLKEKFDLGLFENPYVDVAAAEKLVNNAVFREKADLALRKSIVLLRNESKMLPLKAKTKVYFETYRKNYDKPAPGPGEVYSNAAYSKDVEIVSTPEAADIIILWVQPVSKPLFASDGSPLNLSLSKCSIDVNYINDLTSKKPTVLVMSYSNPWVIDEIYNDQTKKRFAGVLATFGNTHEAVLDVVTGKFKPTGKMPFSTPVSAAVVESNKEDVPGYLEPKGYALFNFDEGLTYK